MVTENSTRGSTLHRMLDRLVGAFFEIQADIFTSLESI